MIVVLWVAYALIAILGAYTLFPHNVLGGLRVFLVVGLVLLIGGWDYYRSKLLTF